MAKGASMPSVSNSAKQRAERLVYRVAGLPVALSAAWAAGRSADTGFPVELAFASSYWHPADLGEWTELIVAIAAWPFALLAGALWFTARNGPTIRRRDGKGLSRQLVEQLRLYFSAGVLPPWYYVFALHEDSCPKRARSFLQRFETKPCIFPLLKARRGSPLNDKAEFAAYCAAHGIRCVETIMQIDGQVPKQVLPDRDLFVKRVRGRGGRGAERWDRVAPFTFRSPDGERLDVKSLLQRLAAKSRKTPLIVQPRLAPHRALSDASTGALPTIRIVTCLDERGRPEVIGAVFRMAIGENVTVDNLHAGGIAAAVDLDSGCLSCATNLGTDARLGWLSTHPDTGTAIEGRALPLWGDVKSFAADAHRAFTDRVVIGWDVAILDDGPILIEGNGNPDMDILQRFMRTGLREHRFGALLGHHLRQRAGAAH
jgi:hypothetical protein